MSGMVDKKYVSVVLFEKKSYKLKHYKSKNSQLAYIYIYIFNVIIFWDFNVSLYRKDVYLLQVDSARKHMLPIDTQLRSVKKYITLK